MKLLVYNLYLIFLKKRSTLALIYVKKLMKFRNATSFKWETAVSNYEIHTPIDELAHQWASMLVGGYSQFETCKKIVEKYCRASPVMFVVGANIGLNEIVLSEVNNSTIHSFEPIPENHEYLVQNIRGNNIKNIEIYNYGLSKKSGVIPIAVNGDSSSLTNVSDTVFDKIECYFSTIDDFFLDNKLDRLDFLKIDVEGHDVEVLKGGENTILKYKPVIQIEIFKEPTLLYFDNYDIDWLETLLGKLSPRYYEIYRDRIIEVESIDQFLKRDIIQNDLVIVPS